HSTLAGALLFLVADLVISRRGSASLSVSHPHFAQAGLVGSLFFLAAIGMAGMPPLSGFLGKLLILDALRDDAILIWPVVLTASLIMILGFARVGSELFWKSRETAAPPPDHPTAKLALAAAFGLVAGLIGLTVFAGPIMAWLEVTAIALHEPAAYIAANALEDLP
ncbi:MAG: proton-conducting transporter membrane subunit, partial [Paracoccaceae bacterium]